MNTSKGTWTSRALHPPKTGSHFGTQIISGEASIPALAMSIAFRRYLGSARDIVVATRTKLSVARI